MKYGENNTWQLNCKILTFPNINIARDSKNGPMMIRLKDEFTNLITKNYKV